MRTSCTLVCVLVLALAPCLKAFEDLRRGFTQARSFIMGGKVYAMGEFRPDKERGWPGRLVLQSDDTEGSGLSEFILPITVSHSIEGVQTRTCWSLAPGRVWVLAESEEATKEDNYSVFSMNTANLGSWLFKGSIPAQTPLAAAGTDRVRALPIQVRLGLREQTLQDFRDTTNPLLVAGFDIHAAGSDALVLYLLVGGRMTVWSYSPGGYSRIEGRVLGPYRIDGPPLMAAGKWRQLATFDVPFYGQFAAIHDGQAVYFLTSEGDLFACYGLDSRPKLAGSSKPIIEGSETAYTPQLRFAERFFGENDPRITVEYEGSVSPGSMILEDLDSGRAYIMADSFVIPLTPAQGAIPLYERKGPGNGLIADAMDMVRAIASASQATSDTTQKMQQEPASSPEPVQEQKPSYGY
jgi:hypothetical protein